MKGYILTFDDFAHFEVVLLGYLMKASGHNLVTASVDGGPVTSFEGFRVSSEVSLKDISPEAVDLFVIPGGIPTALLGNSDLQALLTQLNEQNVTLASICHGTMLLADAGIMIDRKFTSNVLQSDPEYPLFRGHESDDDVVVDGNIITARGNAYVEFALEVSKNTGIIRDGAELQDYRSFFKNVQ